MAPWYNKAFEDLVNPLYCPYKPYKKLVTCLEALWHPAGPLPASLIQINSMSLNVLNSNQSSLLPPGPLGAERALGPLGSWPRPWVLSLP